MRSDLETIARRALCVAGVCALLLPALVGCSRTKLAVGAMGPILENTKLAALASNDVRTFTAGAPSNLLLMEGLIRTEPESRSLRVTASMSYFSYAFLFDDPADEGYASMLYLKGLEHGKAALLLNEKMRAAWDKPFDQFVEGTKQLTDKDLEAAVWTVANWSQFIALHLDSTQVLTQIPRVVALLERAIQIDGEYLEGLPLMIMGSLHAFRPPLMGGNPEASRKAFDAAIAVSEGKFLLASYFYAKFYCYRVQDADEFEKRLLYVLEQPDTIMPEYRLMNAMAKQRAATLLKEKNELF